MSAVLTRLCARWSLASTLVCAMSGCVLPPATEEASGSVQAAIVGGTLDGTTRGVVLLERFDVKGGNSAICSGTLIARNLVLTARHCVAPLNGDGSHVNCTDGAFLETYPASELFVSTATRATDSADSWHAVHEVRTTAKDAKVCGSDLALVILEGSGVAPEEATPMEPELDLTPSPGDSFSALGFGIQRADDVEGLTVGSRMRADGQRVFCVGAECPSIAGVSGGEWVARSAACPGDSGGPALSTSGRVFGVLSRGADDCSIAVTCYSNVASWSALIRSTALDASALGAYPAPAWTVPPTSDVPSSTGCALRATTHSPRVAAAAAALLLGLVLLSRARRTREGASNRRLAFRPLNR